MYVIYISLNCIVIVCNNNSINVNETIKMNMCEIPIYIVWVALNKNEFYLFCGILNNRNLDTLNES